MEQEQKPAVNKWLLATLIVVLVGATGYFAWNYYSLKNAAPIETKDDQSTTKTTTQSNSPKLVDTTKTNSTQSTSAPTTPTPTLTPTPTPSEPQWKTFKEEGLYSFQYPGNWFAKYDTMYYRYIITNKEECLTAIDLTKNISSECQIVIIWAANSAGSVDQRTAYENQLKTKAGIQVGTIRSGDMTIRTYSGDNGKGTEFVAFFGNKNNQVDYSVGSSTNESSIITTAKKILATIQ